MMTNERRIGRLSKRLRAMVELVAEYRADGEVESAEMARKAEASFWDRLFREMPKTGGYDRINVKQNFVVYGVRKDGRASLWQWLVRVVHA